MGPILEQNRVLAHGLGIEKRVFFMGDMAHAEVLPYFEACALFVVTSRAEPFGLVVLEAAYYRKGMVCTRVGGITLPSTKALEPMGRVHRRLRRRVQRRLASRRPRTRSTSGLQDTVQALTDVAGDEGHDALVPMAGNFTPGREHGGEVTARSTPSTYILSYIAGLA
jgi:hypothetical protein